MGSPPLFSVIIPTYNRSDLLEQTLDSILQQSQLSYEVIVVDDGSTDDTTEVVRNHPLNPTYLRQENAGPGAARNRGITHAQGTYLAFLDSDDLWFPWTLEIVQAVIEENEHPSFISMPMAEWGCRTLRTSPSPTETQVYPDFLTAAREGYFVSMASAIVRKDAFLNHTDGFLTEPINAEDHDLSLQLGTAPTFVRIEQPPMVSIRKHDVQLTKNLDKTFRGLSYLLDREQAGDYPGGDDRKWARRYILAQHVRSWTVSGLRNGYFKTSFQLYLRTLRWQIKFRRWKYLLGFPLLALIAPIERLRDD